MRQSSSGFTLLEVLLAIAITGFVLASAVTLVVSVSSIWASRQDSNFFEDHVDGVTEFVSSCFANAGVEVALERTDTSEDEPDIETQEDGQPTVSVDTTPEEGQQNSSSNSNNQGSGLIRVSDQPIAWVRPPGFADFEDPLINFRLREQPPLLVNLDNAPALGVDAFLYFDSDEGLSLLWYSILQEETEEKRDLRRTLLSPYVQALQFIYWDERFERWETENEPKEQNNDEFALPRYVKLIFEREGVTKERTLAIPVPSQSALLF